MTILLAPMVGLLNFVLRDIWILVNCALDANAKLNTQKNRVLFKTLSCWARAGQQGAQDFWDFIETNAGSLQLRAG